MQQPGKQSILEYAPSSSVTLAFCPVLGPNGTGQALLATGTVAGAVDVTFSSTSQLELVSLDFTSPNATPAVVGAVQAPERFHRLAWGTPLASEPGFPQLGLLAGGLADGSVCLWDPARIAAHAEGQQPLLARMQKHQGAVKGLEFNSFSPNLLATGAADADLCIWDLTKPSTPSLYPALKTAAVAPGSEVQHLSWNRKVQHILASCCSNGTTVVWDLKRQKPVISFRDNNSQRRASVLQWNPEVATQLVVASDDDRSPTLQMWDLRNSTSPVKEFVGHSKGVLSMAWCLADPTLLISTGKDNRNICWDVTTTDVMCELPAARGWDFEVAWAPHARGVFATSCYEHLVSVHNILDCTSPQYVDAYGPDMSVIRTPTGEVQPLKRVPNWMRRPCGATFGFGGKLISFTNHKGPNGNDHGTINITQVVTEPELVSRSETFESVVTQGSADTLLTYCAGKAQEAEVNSVEEAETWAFLRLLFAGANARRELQKMLGYEDVLVSQTSVGAPGGEGNGNALGSELDGLNLGPDGRPAAQGGGGAANGVSTGGAAAAQDFFGGQEDDPNFFDNLPDEGLMAAPPSPLKGGQSGGLAGRGPQLSEVPGEGVGGSGALAARASHMPELGADASQELEEEIQRAMIAGNYEAAVESCFKAHRLADALLIANVMSSKLFKTTMARYMKLCPKPYMHIVRAIGDKDFEGLVRTRPVGQWRETLALLATYVQSGPSEWAKQCDLLAARLAAAGMNHAALLCHICGGNLDAAVAYWARVVGQTKAVEALQGVMEKSVIMSMAVGSQQASGALGDLITTYSSLLAAQGRLRTALDYLGYVQGEASTTVAVLRDRIFRAQPQGWQHASAPPFPYVMVDVKPTVTYTPPAAVQPAQAAPGSRAGYPGSPYGAAQPQQQAQAGAYGGWNQPAAQHTAPQPAAASAYSAYSAPSQPATQWSAYGQSQPPQQAAPPPPPPQPATTDYYHSAQAFNPATTNAASRLSAYTQQPASHSYQQPSAYGQASSYAPPPQTAAPPPPSQPPAGSVYTVNRPHAPPPAPPPVSTSSPSYAHPGVPTVPTASTPTATVPPPAAQFMPTTTAPPAIPTPAPTMYSNVPAAPTAAAPVPAAPIAPAKPAPPPAPAGPPANISIASVDTSGVPGDRRGIVTSLTNLYNSCLPLATNPVKKREMEDNTKKLGQLLWRLGHGEVSEGVVPKLQQLCAAIDAGDWPTANHIQVQMTTTDWEECGYWLSAVKRLVKMRM